MADEMMMTEVETTEVSEVSYEGEESGNGGSLLKVGACIVGAGVLIGGGIAFAKTKGKELIAEHKEVKKFRKAYREEMAKLKEEAAEACEEETEAEEVSEVKEEKPKKK